MFSLVFPGQGSQSVGMLQDWAAQVPEVLDTFAQASEILNYDLWALIQAGPDTQLNQTEFTQPALLVAGVALYRVFKRQATAVPRYLAGHSLGEYTALVCAEALAFEAAVKLVQMRGRFMQAAVPVGQGAMAAIVGLMAPEVDKICQQIATPENNVASANYNADGQVVVAGHVQAVEAVIAAANAQGAKIAKKLIMSVPSHCQLMKPAATALAAYLENVTVKTPILPVIHNVDVAEHATPDSIKQALVAQLYQPVRWTETIAKMTILGVKKQIECGPGKVLTGLSKRIMPGPDVALSLSSSEAFQTVLNEVNR